MLGSLAIEAILVPARVDNLGSLASSPDVHQVVQGEVPLVPLARGHEPLDGLDDHLGGVRDVHHLDAGVLHQGAVVAPRVPHLPALARVKDLTKVLELLLSPTILDVLAVPHHLPQVVIVGLLAHLVSFAHVYQFPQSKT